MLVNDSVTIAAEVPVFLTKNDIGYYRSRGFDLAGCGKRGVATQALSSFSILCSGKTVTGIVLGPTN